MQPKKESRGKYIHDSYVSYKERKGNVVQTVLVQMAGDKAQGLMWKIPVTQIRSCLRQPGQCPHIEHKPLFLSVDTHRQPGQCST